jgi:hypothetical protein
MHVPSVLCRPRGHAADVRTNANTYTRGVEPLCSPRPTAHIPVRTLTLDLRTYSCDPHRHRTRLCVGEPHLATLCRLREPQRVGTRCSPKPSDARSNHLGRLDPHHLPALAWSPPSLRRHYGTLPQSRCHHGYAAAVPAHRRGLDAGKRKRSPLPCATTHARARA